MNEAEKAKQADELAVLAMASLRAFLEGKASLHISQPAPLTGAAGAPAWAAGSLTIVRFIMDPAR